MIGDTSYVELENYKSAIQSYYQKSVIETEKLLSIVW